MEKLAVIVIVIIVLVMLTFLIAKYVLHLCTLEFQGEKYLIPFKDRKCPVVDFEGKSYRKNIYGNWLPENCFTLNEITWATEKANYKVIDVLPEAYLKIFSTKSIAMVIAAYLVFIYGALILSGVNLLNNLNSILFFWIGLLSIVSLKEVAEKVRKIDFSII